MTHVLRTLFSLFVLIAASTTLRAATILDTGPITGEFSKGLNPSTWQAIEFTLTEQTMITSLEGYMYGTQDNFALPPESVTAAVYSAGDDELPGDRLHEASFLVPHTPPSEVDWRGVSSIEWTLEPGVYWAVFAVDESEFRGAMPFNTGGGSGRAVRVDRSFPGEPPVDPVWIEAVDPLHRLGFRITGQPVPEPNNICLLASTLLVLINQSRPRS